MLYEVHEMPKAVRVLIYVVAVLLALCLIQFYTWLYTGVLGKELPKTRRLRHENAELASQVDVLSHQLDSYEEVLSGIEARDNLVYRSIFGLGDIKSPVRPVPKSVYEQMLARGASPDLVAARERLDGISRRSVCRLGTLEEVGGVAVRIDDRISHVPAVPPVRPDEKVRRSSPFGVRTDPVHGGRRFHEGVDLASFKGNPVYATGDAVVVSTKYQFFGYGNLVILSHGFGYETRYAHLKTINVQEGQKVFRGDKIGELGNSGKSTGPHLHYEVLYNGKKVNPMSYFDLDMDVEEFDAMVREREEQSARSYQAPSTLDILRRKQK